MKTSAARVVFVTAPSGRRAERLARALVVSRLAACVNVVPLVQSFYRWKGVLHRDAESLLVIKTAATRLKSLESWLKIHHPYEVPEILSVRVDAGSRSYLDWLFEQVDVRGSKK